MSLTLTLFGIVLRCCSFTGMFDKESTVAQGIGGCCGLPMALFTFSWFIAGNVWVFGQWSSVNFKDEESEHYCDSAAYMLSFVLLILSWVVAPIASIITCCCLGIIASKKWTLKDHHDHGQTNEQFPGVFLHIDQHLHYHILVLFNTHEEAFNKNTFIEALVIIDTF